MHQCNDTTGRLFRLAGRSKAPILLTRIYCDQDQLPSLPSLQQF
jgi:hypothetical protein